TLQETRGGSMINDCYDHWMIWAQIAHADVTNIRIEELKEHQAA
ncbi:hypothetical protein ACIQGB_005426, partial [Escherichia coli]